ncbi:dUTP diphosphatase [Lactobacillus sp. S2-2]|uniref:dUTP diphosphatase n=1 Tax=Lactobacillus sp. S2-2 TaxID=2692917 RepID=UPI001F34A411|nr:dUTP diphosphatase [Lactobacillus sp. S2-2]MCF6515637.1 dUTP diphosphatase [Lactobacillus sp. S2-2]
MKRGFNIVSKYQNSKLNLPKRATNASAGYDFESAEDFVLPSIWKKDFLNGLWLLKHQDNLSDEDLEKAQKIIKPYLIPTGIKAYMQDDEFLMIANRSSGPLKRNMVVPNGIGVIDSDYYDNDKNEGEIFIQLMNFGLLDRKIKKGDKIGQGIFMPYLKTDNDDETDKMKRTGGFGSSGQ